jgi:outer membrane lipoprotein-sorting protein
MTRLTFSNVETGVSLPEDSFRFVPPEGVDVVGKQD